MTDELQRAFVPVAEAFELLGIEYRVGGSVASAALGVSRTTLDVDVVAAVREEHANPLAARLAGDYYVAKEDIRDAARHGRAFNLIHFATMFKVDVFVRGTRPYDLTAFERCVQAPIGNGGDRTFPVTTPEDIVLRKLEWFERGGRTSERQWTDVLGVLKVQRSALDLAYMQRWAPTLGVDGLLESALRQVDESL